VGHGVDLDLGLGSDASGQVELPLALTIGAWLVRDAIGPGTGAIGYSVDPGEPELPRSIREDDVALVVLGDGSACRSLKAPGYLDERAAPFDARLARVLSEGRPDLLHRELLDDTVADVAMGPAVGELKVSGVAAWDAVSWLLEGPVWDAELRYDDAPFGVGYFVAVWNRRG
jgi:hypothetical protein